MTKLLLLHGWGGNEKSFAPILPVLKMHFDCIVPRLPMFQTTADGQGDPVVPWTLDDYADMVERILDEQGVDQCPVLAHSFGARVVAIMATRRPQLFTRMLLTGAAGIPPRFSLRTWLRVRWHKLTKRGRGSTEYQALTRPGKLTFQNVLRHDLRPLIREIQTPTLLIYGTRDRATPIYMGKRWTWLAKNATMIQYKGAGHFAYLDNTARFLTDTLKFLQGD